MAAARTAGSLSRLDLWALQQQVTLVTGDPLLQPLIADVICVHQTGGSIGANSIAFMGLLAVARRVLYTAAAARTKPAREAVTLTGSLELNLAG